MQQYYWVAYHMDSDSCKIMHVALNHQDEYQGGRLVFVTNEGLLVFVTNASGVRDQ